MDRAASLHLEEQHGVVRVQGFITGEHSLGL